MSGFPMLDNIVAQPESHRGVVEHCLGKQRATLIACAAQLRACRGRIIFSGMGASLFAALPAVSRLEQQGYRAQAAESSELLHYGAAGLRRGDVGVLISRSGGSIEVLRLAERMRSDGIPLIGITNLADSPLAFGTDICLVLGAQPDQLIAIQTYSGTLLGLLLLAEEVISGESAQLGNACLTCLPVLSEFIEQNLHVSEGWRDLFDAPGALYLMGRGQALASVHEGALLLHETAKVPAIAISSGQFRHGPVEVVSDSFRAVIFGSPPLTRGMDRSLAGDLVKMGAKVRWIGPAVETDRVQSLVAWPPLGPDSALAAIFEIVPLQVAAYRLALWRGITPGDFRYASEVTAEESGFPFFDSKSARV
jgi:glucosamine--fructose-6-phosphate aminotransferase (isomerizing)